jgi:hypothetical protein
MSVSGLFVATRKTVHLLIMTAYDVNGLTAAARDGGHVTAAT